MYDPVAERVATTIRTVMRSQLPGRAKQSWVKALIQQLKYASKVNAIRSLLDSGDLVEKWLSVDDVPPLPSGICDGEALIRVVNGIAFVARCHVAGELRVDDQGQLIYESSITIETAHNWHALEFDAWVELQSIGAGRVQHACYPCSPSLFARASFGD
jgi:hypothetical protein